MENYLDVLEESLKKKSRLLDELAEISQKQLALIDSEDMTPESYDVYVDEKSERIDALTKLDDGFATLYENIGKQLEQNKDKYRSQIQNLQRLITEVTEKSVSLQALEARNKSKVEAYFAREKQSIRIARQTSKAALNYYQNMNDSKNVQAQFLDKKK